MDWLLIIGIAIAVLVAAIIVIDHEDPEPRECSFYDPCPECQEREL